MFSSVVLSVCIEDQADIALLNEIGQVPKLHVVVILGTHAVEEELGVIDDTHAASGDLQDIIDDLDSGQDLLRCRDGIDGAPADGLGQEESQSRFASPLLADDQVDAATIIAETVYFL